MRSWRNVLFVTLLALPVFFWFLFSQVHTIYAVAVPQAQPAQTDAGVSEDQNAFLEAIIKGRDAPNLNFLVGDSSYFADGEYHAGQSINQTTMLYFIQNLGLGINRDVQVMGPDGKMITKRITSPGALSTTMNLTAQLYQRSPASSVEYIADVMQNIQRPFGATPAYAQGIGFSSLSPVLSLWKIFRNIAYFFLTVVFMIVGFLIMIRAKIGSQAAVTVQQMLPKLILTLILISFSYAIAGLMIDVMNIMIFLLIRAFAVELPTLDLSTIAFRNDIFTNGVQIITGGVADSISKSMGTIVAQILGNLGWADVTKNVVGFGAGVVFALVLIIVILVSLFRVFLALLTAYINIFFTVIFAPLELLISGGNWQAWLKRLFENLLVFPTIVLLIFIAYFFTQPVSTEINSDNPGFTAPQLGSNQGAGFGTYKAFLALGAILAMPEILKVAKGLMKGEMGVGVGDLVNNLKQGVPLGSRLAAGPAAGLAMGGYAMGKDLFKYARGGKLNARTFASSVGSGKEGFSKGVGYGLTGAQRVSRALNANQPDILNPVTGLIDKKFNPEVAKKQERLQEIEDAIDLLDETQRRKT